MSEDNTEKRGPDSSDSSPPPKQAKDEPKFEQYLYKHAGKTCIVIIVILYFLLKIV
ncbi:MAG: hypothetical protein HN509_14345 [Halobacteriovoraceae bacterium]|nr:hypothetical protein [Halobacteriovoraceae bacterium]